MSTKLSLTLFRCRNGTSNIRRQWDCHKIVTRSKETIGINYCLLLRSVQVIIKYHLRTTDSYTKVSGFPENIKPQGNLYVDHERHNVLAEPLINNSYLAHKKYDELLTGPHEEALKAKINILLRGHIKQRRCMCLISREFGQGGKQYLLLPL